MKKKSVYTLVLYALFVALVLLLGLTPVGLIPLGFINLTILCIPVIIGTILLGLKGGLLLGFCMGLVSMLSAMGLSMTAPSGLASNLLAASPILLILNCFIPRLLVPVTTHLVYQAIAKGKESKIGIVPAAIVGSLTNTILYLGLMLLFYTWCNLDSTTLLGIIGGTGLIGGGCEAIAAAVLATPIVMAARKIRRN